MANLLEPTDAIINAWKGWRLEFSQRYGSDCDGATEYSSYTSYDWSTDLADIISRNMMGWLTGKVEKYSQVYLEEASVDELKVHFTCGYAITLTKEKPSYGYNFAFGHGDYRNSIRLVSPWDEAQKKIANYNEIWIEYKCLMSLKPKEVAVPENVILPVDLGLSVDWAPFNLGASAQEDLGDVFGWSEIVPDKEGYAYHLGFNDENGNHIYNDRGNSLYEFSGMKGEDAAREIWGEGWRVPNEDEIDELLYNCEWKWKKLNGREGYEVTGRTGNSIFLPVNNSYMDWEGRYGMSLWSSSGYMMPGGSTKGYTLEISNYVQGDMYNHYKSDCGTATTLNIRPVHDKKQ